MRLVGLSGYARSGKDETAAVLVDNGWTRIAFADKLREFLYALNPIISYEFEYSNVVLHDVGIVKEFLTSVTDIRLRQVIDMYGWDGYKNSPYAAEIRPLLQRLGTEAGRQVISDTIWIDAALNDLDPDGNYVVTDCRFPNEAEAIVQRGGDIYRVTRPGVGPANSHASETSLDNWNFTGHLVNDGSLEEYRDKVYTYFLD